MNRLVRALVISALVMGVTLMGTTLAVAAPARASESHILSGRVMNPEAEGVDDVEVGLYEWDAAGLRWIRVNWTVPASDGSYTFTLPVGVYRIGVEPLADPPANRWQYDLPVYLGGGRDVAMSTGVILATNATVDFYLTRNPVVTGTVVATQTATPIEGATVTLYWSESDTSTVTLTDSVLTDASGHYTVSMPSPGRFRVGFSKDGWATKYYWNTYRYEAAEWRGAADWDFGETVLEPGVQFSVDKARSPFGTLLPASWVNPAAGLPYGVEIYRKTTPMGDGTENWELFYKRPAGEASPWPNYLAPGPYKVRYFPPVGTYQARWWAGATNMSAATPLIAEPGQAMVVNADFGGYVKATTSVRSSASSVRKGHSARLTISMRDASLTGRPTMAQPSARARLQRSYNGRSWTTIATLRTGAAGTVSKSVKISRTTYFRAVPVTSATLHGSASRSVRVRAR